MRLPVIALSALVLFSAGCLLHNVSSSERLRDAVVGLNDEARWSRMDLAVERVKPEFRVDFATSRHDWGRGIQIADTELMQVRMGGDGDAAVSVVAVRWYRYDTMTLHATIIRQQWEAAGGTYLLASEQVVDGDQALLAPPEEDEEGSAVSLSLNTTGD